MAMETVQVNTQWIGAMPVDSLPNDGRSHQIRIENGPMADAGLLISVSFLAIWAIVIACYTGMPKYIQRKFFSLKQHSKVPCRDCRFFNNNPYRWVTG
jgi:hypothetical protein